MAWTEQDYQEIVARLMASSIGVNEVPNADKADDVTSLPAFKPSGSNSEASVVNYPLEFLKGEQGEPGIQGEPGKSFKVAGEYATLEALKSAVPDGSAVDGFMAVGTEAPYDYYAWVNGEWVSQGKIGGIEEAPTDGKAYGRKNGDWAEVSDKKYVDDSISSARSVGYMMQFTEIDTSGLDENTWYPVTIAAGERMNIRVEVLVSLDSGTKPSWSTHERGFSTRKIWEFAPCAWGINRDSKTTIYLSDFLHADIDPVRGLGNLSHFVICYVFVRGGGKYHFYASHEAKVILHTDTYAPGDQSVSPTTETPAGIVANIATKEYADNINYGKVINADSGTISNDLVGNGFKLTGVDAEERVKRYFGNLSNFRSVVQDIIENHTRYFIHNSNDSRELGCLNAWKNTVNTEHELHFILTGFGDGNLHTKRYSIRITENTDDARFIIVNIINSDNLTTLTKKTAAEYEDISSKDEGTMYAITDA